MVLSGWARGSFALTHTSGTVPHSNAELHLHIRVVEGDVRDVKGANRNPKAEE